MKLESEAKLNRPKFQALIKTGGHNWTAKEFHKRWTARYGFKIGYNNFMELINNNVSWKLVYAFAIADMLDVDITELFTFSHNNVEELV